MLVHIALSSSKGSGKSALFLRLIGALAARSHTQSMDVDQEEAFTLIRWYPRFSYLSELGGHGHVEFGKRKHLDHQNWGI